MRVRSIEPSVKGGFNSVKRRFVVGDIVEQFTERIRSGELSPGERLAGERELAKEFGVGRPSVREAVGILSAQGLLDVRPGDGTYVSRTATEAVIHAMSRDLYFDRSPLLQLIEFRLDIEPGFAKRAAQRRTVDDLIRLGEALEQMSANFAIAGESAYNEVFSEHDRDFHISLARASKNAVGATVLQHVSLMLYTGMKLTGGIPYAAKKALRFHERLFDSVKARDADLARATMVEHLRDVEADLKRALAQDSEEA